MKAFSIKKNSNITEKAKVLLAHSLLSCNPLLITVHSYWVTVYCCPSHNRFCFVWLTWVCLFN